MENYISINGNKSEITPEQLRQLGITVDMSATSVADIVKRGKARDHFKIHDLLTLGGYEMEIIGFDHDRDADNRTTITLMAKSLLPARRMHSGACKRGWIDTELRKWLNGELIKTLPDDLVSHICNVKKVTHSASGEVFETVDKLFLPSESDLFGSAIWSDYEDGPRYEAFATPKDRIRVDADGDARWYWSRSFVGGYSTGFAYTL